MLHHPYNDTGPLLIPRAKLALATSAAALVRELPVNSSQQARRFAEDPVGVSPDRRTSITLTTRGRLRFITEDPLLSMELKKPPAGVTFICGDDYRGIAYSSRELRPWIITTRGLTFGEPLVGGWEDGWCSGRTTYCMKSGDQFRRIEISEDAAKAVCSESISSPSHFVEVGEVPGRSALLFRHKNGSVYVAPFKSYSDQHAPLPAAPAWAIDNTGLGIDTISLAVSDGGYSAWALTTPKLEGFGVQLQVAQWTMGEKQRLEKDTINVPGSSLFFSAAVSPRCDAIVAIGELSSGSHPNYILHLFTLPDLKLIQSEIFEQKASEPARVEFGADGGVVIVRSSHRIISWSLEKEGSIHLQRVGLFERGSEISGSLATSRHIFLAEYADLDRNTMRSWVALSPQAASRGGLNQVTLSRSDDDLLG